MKYFPYVKVYLTSNAAGALTDYFFEFKSSMYFPKESYLLINLDPGSGFPYNPASTSIACSAISVNNFLVNANFICTRTSSTQISITGFNTFISSGDEIGIKIPLASPKSAQTTGNFTLAAFRYGTSFVYSIRSDIPGVVIAPAGFTTASVGPAISTAVISKLKRMDYLF